VRALTRLAGALLLAFAAAACGSSGSGADRASSTTAASSASSASSAAAPNPCARGAATPPARVAGAPLDTVLRVPARARGHRAPLVLALHFASGTGPEMERATRLTPEARRDGFLVAYPSASESHFWSAAGDFERLTRTLDAIERVACVDRSRVYAVGISNGGYMSTVLACRAADRIAAVTLFAPGINGIGACEPAPGRWPCSRSRGRPTRSSRTATRAGARTRTSRRS
jgi:polyhydroxybutyrate depolymerase